MKLKKIGFLMSLFLIFTFVFNVDAADLSIETGKREQIGYVGSDENVKNNNLFGYNDIDKSFMVRKNTETNIFKVLGEYVNIKSVSNKIVYKKTGNQSLVNISNLTGYTINTKVEKFDGTNFVDAIEYNNLTGEGDYINLVSGFIFKTEGKYKITSTVTFNLSDKTFEITNNNWIYYYEVYSGATAVDFNTEEIWLQSNELYENLIFILKSDASTEPSLANLNIYLKDGAGDVYVGEVDGDTICFTNNPTEPTSKTAKIKLIFKFVFRRCTWIFSD